MTCFPLHRFVSKSDWSFLLLSHALIGTSNWLSSRCGLSYAWQWLYIFFWNLIGVFYCSRMLCLARVTDLLPVTAVALCILLGIWLVHFNVCAFSDLRKWWNFYFILFTDEAMEVDEYDSDLETPRNTEEASETLDNANNQRHQISTTDNSNLDSINFSWLEDYFTWWYSVKMELACT